MTTSTSILRPGVLVSLKSSVSGGVHYLRNDLEVLDTVTSETEARARWETTRVVADAAEHDRAVKARGAALTVVRRQCAHTSFGLLCPLDAEKQLDEAIAAARRIVGEFNATAKHTHVSIFALKGTIATTDQEAARAIGDEVASLVADMNAAIDRLDPEAIREAANKARSMSLMLAEEQAAVVGEAIKQARAAARQIVKRVQNDGEAAGIVLADVQRGALERARLAFLDLDDAPEVPAVTDMMPSVQARDLDLDDVEVPEITVGGEG